MTNAKLLRFHNEIQAMRGGIFEMWHFNKINDFYKENNFRLKALTDRVMKLNLEYFQSNDGKVIYDEKQQPIPKEGTNIDEYRAKFTEIMNQEIHIV